MSDFLLTHNPDKSDPPVLREMSNWSFGTRKTGASPGDTVWLLRQGRGPRGIFARGAVLSPIYQDAHWAGPGVANYADVEWESMRCDPIPLAVLRAEAPGTNWSPQASGTLIPGDDAAILADMWADWAKP